MKKKILVILVSFVVVLSSSLFIYYFCYEKKEYSYLDTYKKEKDKEVKLTLVGDFLFEEPFYKSISLGDNKDNYFKNVKEYFESDDLSIGNMEVVIGNENMETSGTGFNFCAPTYIGDLVSSLSLEVLTTANNHTFDRGVEGINSTLDYFKNKTNIITVGTYYSEEDRNKPRIKEIKGMKIGFLAYTYGTNQKIPHELRSRVGLYKNPDTREIDDEYLNKIEKEVINLRSKVDALIVMMHWGIEFTHEENEEQVKMANFLNSLGVDIIVGSHSHSIEPIKWIGSKHRTLVYYSMGNFASSDEDVGRAGNHFDNAYQVGLLSKLNLRKDNRELKIENIQSMPVINYYDGELRNFELIPYNLYSEKYEKSHYRYPEGFTKNFVNDMFKEVISEEFR